MCVTYIVPRHDAIHKLNPSHDNEERHKGVKEECALRRLREISLPDVLDYDLRRGLGGEIAGIDGGGG